MKLRFLTRQDKRHSSAQPANRRCRARRLAFERCEDRLVLSGSSLTAPIVSAHDAGEGGFLSLDSSDFLQTSTNDFLYDVDYSSTLSTDPLLANFWNLLNFGQSVGENISINTGVPIGSGIFTTAHPDAASGGKEFASSISTFSTIDVGPAFFEFDTANRGVIESLVPTQEIHILRNDVNANIGDGDDRQNDPLPGLGGKTARPLVIVDPIQLTASLSSTSRSDLREGGALEVAVAVTTAQRAYETQLAAIVVHNLNHDEILPVAVPQRIQPVVAELARAVAFETLGQQTTIPTGKADQVIEDLMRQPTRSVPPMLEPVSARLDRMQMHHTAAATDVVEESAIYATKKATRHANSSVHLAERVDDEQQVTQAATYAQWPALAAVIAGYLMVDRSVAPTISPVQRLPRRDRQSL